MWSQDRGVGQSGVKSQERQELLLFSKTSTSALLPTQPPTQITPEFFPGVKCPEHEVDPIQLKLVLGLRMSTAAPLLYCMLSWCKFNKRGNVHIM
jgi:hypothetical protein